MPQQSKPPSPSAPAPDSGVTSATAGADGCRDCGGRRWQRTSAGWRKCASCWWEVANRMYILPVVKQRDTTLPLVWRDRPPFPLADLTEYGDYDAFRLRAWASLLRYAPQRLTYDYFEAGRLAEIHFGRETAPYKSTRDLLSLDLLVLVAGLADPPNSFLPSLVQAVTRLRRMHGKPTWLYTAARGQLKPSVEHSGPVAVLPTADSAPTDPTVPAASDAKRALSAALIRKKP